MAEDLNRRLSHNVRRGSTDATTKPNKDEKKRIDKILQSVGNQISTEDLDFLYRLESADFVVSFVTVLLFRLLFGMVLGSATL